MGYSKRRDRIIDIVRGFAIISVVMGHCGFPFFSFTCRFQTALFFIISGLFWKDQNAASVNNIFWQVKHLIKTLWIPYVLWNVAFLFLNNYLCSTGLYICNIQEYEQAMGKINVGMLHSYYSIKQIFIESGKILLFMGGTELGGASWFFRVLFFAEILFSVVQYLFNKIKVNKIIVEIPFGICLSLIGHYLYNYYCKQFEGSFVGMLIEYLGLWLMAFGLLTLGHILKIIHLRYEGWYNSNLFAIIMIVIGFGVSLMLFKSKIVFFHKNYGMTVALFAMMFLWGQAFLIDKYIDKLAKILSYFGSNTIPIFMGHFAVFKVVSVIIVMINGYPHYYVGAFPYLGEWMPYGIINTFLGTTIPLILYLGFKAINNNVKRVIKLG